MIGRLNGLLLEKNPPQITLDVGGVGYEIDVPMSTFYNLPALGERVELFIHHVVREDGQFLFGFAQAGERLAFRQLLKVSGIGPRTALAVLSGLSVDDLAQAIARQEAGRLIKIPGIGRKTAERLLLELRDKLPAAGVTQVTATPAAPDAAADIQNALLALGYSEREAVAALKQLAPGISVTDGIRQALRLLAKS
ncbi:MAG: Holliday junction branch migration protein RuvA [Rhodocyclaceae bacterium]|nr:Holliday junction branch migration protein RuvA [Rhodocyclaceae bacterium]MBX3669070.1 Holliday junction branch migration protein RuvA [Rhodocyclaceae bacterium]